MNSKRKTRRDPERRRRQAMVEAALTLGLFLFVTMGVIECGTGLYLYESLTERARASLRYAVVNSYDTTAIENVVVYGNAAGSGSAILSVTPEMVTVTMEPIDSTTSLIRVVIAKPDYKFFTPFLAGGSFPLRVEATRVVEGLGSTG